MTFEDEGIIIDVKPQGEKQAILTFFTQEHGLHKGIITVTKANSSYLQAGVIHKVTWTARLSEHLGSWQIDPIYTPIPFVLNNKLALLALTCACEFLSSVLPEREPHTLLYDYFEDLVKGFESHHWFHLYCYFECELVRSIAMPLNFSSCAATGTKEHLCFVSPKSGRAVSRDAAKGYENKLLPLPFFMVYPDINHTPTIADIVQSLEMTGYFIDRFVLNHLNKPMPSLRSNFIKQLEVGTIL